MTYDSGRISQRPVRSACAQRRDRVALGLDRAAEERRRTRSCCTRAGRRTRRCSRRSARGTGGSRAASRPRTVSTAQNMSAPGGIGYGPDRHAANGFAVWSPATPTSALGLRVVRLQLVVVDAASRRCRRRRSGRARDARWKSTSRKRGSLPSAWNPPPPTVDGRLLTSPVEDAVAVGFGAAERARLEQRVGTEEVAADELDLVVADSARAARTARRARAGGCGPSRA